MPHVIVQIQRVQLAEALSGDLALRTHELDDARIAHVYGVAANRLRLVIEQPIHPPAHDAPDTLVQPPRLEVAGDDHRRVIGGDTGIENRLSVRESDLDHRCAVAHAHAADALHLQRRVKLCGSASERVEHAVAAFRRAAGIKRNTNLTNVAVARR